MNSVLQRACAKPMYHILGARSAILPPYFRHGGVAMRFVFNARKAAQAAAHLVKLHGGSINLMALIKLLYLADRQALLETGYPITGDRMVSMPHGPVLSRIYDSAKWGNTEGEPWYEYISERNNHDVSLLLDPPESDELSQYELEVLRKIHDDFGSMSQWELRDLTHTLPEWQDPQGSSLPIDAETILRMAGKSDQEIQRYSLEAEEVYFLSTVGTARP